MQCASVMMLTACLVAIWHAVSSANFDCVCRITMKNITQKISNNWVSQLRGQKSELRYTHKAINVEGLGFSLSANIFAKSHKQTIIK